LKVIYSCTRIDFVGSPVMEVFSKGPLLPTSSKAFLSFNTIPILIELAVCLREHLTRSGQESKERVPV
jgi:hypothetical protein